MSILTANTITQKPYNEDAFSLILNLERGINGICIADGLGSMPHCSEAAAFVTQFFKSKFENSLLPEPDENFLRKCFLECRDELQLYATNLNIPDYNSSTMFGTTCILMLELPEKFIFSYIGNGAIWHIRPNIYNFNKRFWPIPWVAMNYLNPHSVLDLKTNREAIYKLFSPDMQDAGVMPTFLTLAKDRIDGDIIMICTDGIHSNDQSPLGVIAKTGEIWKKMDQSLDFFLRSLGDFYKSGTYTQDNLNSIMNGFLDSLKQKRLLDDDATIGVLLTDNALQFIINQEQQ
jgi:hypothetical protein